MHITQEVMGLLKHCCAICMLEYEEPRGQQGAGEEITALQFQAWVAGTGAC